MSLTPKLRTKFLVQPQELHFSLHTCVEAVLQKCISIFEGQYPAPSFNKNLQLYTIIKP